MAQAVAGREPARAIAEAEANKDQSREESIRGGSLESDRSGWKNDATKWRDGSVSERTWF